MSVYQIPKENFQELYIFEGGLFHYDLTNIDFSIIVNCVDYPSMPENINTPDYLDCVKISFKNYTYLRFVKSYDIGEKSYENSIELGEITCKDNLLDYGGSLQPVATSFGIPTNFTIEIICDNIELEII
ncbi:hypothetical protein [Faucicola atlantae]|uniref:Uncharacterized protein n=1 Tax=Faucicola atlantae TaxID=34059 RepID=A0A1B8QBN0_9GAMM|nr:hypothetical protein [Moraxella atlantae]OBX77153.1 hypothetical protein A9306_09800 [Moraxella atlantae]